MTPSDNGTDSFTYSFYRFKLKIFKLYVCHTVPSPHIYKYLHFLLFAYDESVILDAWCLYHIEKYLQVIRPRAHHWVEQCQGQQVTFFVY